MRLLCFLFLLAFAGAVGLFAYQNQDEINLVFHEWRLTTSVAVVAGVAFLLGMFSGWSIVGMVRRSIHGVTHESPQQRRYVNTV